jgi:outer membrane protein
MPSLSISLRSFLQRASVCTLVLFCIVPAQATTPNARQLAAYERTPEDGRVKLLMSLASSPEADQVTFLLERYPLEGPYATSRTLFLEGLVLKSKGKYTQAAKKFRAVLANDPKLSIVRAELAETLVILQQDDSALHHLRLLAAEAPDKQTASNLRSFIEQVDARRPYKFTGYVSVAPSTNVNSGSKHTKVYSPLLQQSIDLEQPSSGIGFAGGISAAFTKRVGDDFMASGGMDVRLYDNDQYNSYGLSQSIELRRLVSNGYFGLGLVSSQQLDSEDYRPSYISYGPRLSASLELSPKDHFSFGILHEWREPQTKGSSTSTALLIDGSLTHSWNATLNATLFGGFDRIKTDDAVASYRTVSAGLSVYKELTHGITVNLMGQVAKTDHDAFNLKAGVTRADKKFSGSITLTKRDFNFQGFAPTVTYSFSDNFSNINTYDYVSHAVDFRLTKDF